MMLVGLEDLQYMQGHLVLVVSVGSCLLLLLLPAKLIPYHRDTSSSTCKHTNVFPNIIVLS